MEGRVVKRLKISSARYITGARIGISSRSKKNAACAEREEERRNARSVLSRGSNQRAGIRRGESVERCHSREAGAASGEIGEKKARPRVCDIRGENAEMRAKRGDADMLLIASQLQDDRKTLPAEMKKGPGAAMCKEREKKRTPVACGAYTCSEASAGKKGRNWKDRREGPPGRITRSHARRFHERTKVWRLRPGEAVTGGSVQKRNLREGGSSGYLKGRKK